MALFPAIWISLPTFGRFCLLRWATPFLTALYHKQELGSVRIIHPFHPQYNHEFQVLKARKFGNRLILSLQESERGSFGILADWTDYFSSDPPIISNPNEYISTSALTALCEMVKKTDK
jgi:hypothetical protein